jgi:hypothetical protein
MNSELDRIWFSSADSIVMSLGVAIGFSIRSPVRSVPEDVT